MKTVFSVIFTAGVPDFLPEIVALIVAGAGIAYICQRFNLVPILGFLLAGVFIGPNGLGLVRDQDLVNAAAEVGVVLLLFTIGIEFSLEKLARIKRLIFVGGGLQVALSTLVTLAFLAFWGVDWRTGLFTGFLISLSSTAIVLKLLADRGETSTLQGQINLALLIFQDLAIIVMVLIVPMLSGTGGTAGSIFWALWKALMIILAVLVFARRLMPRVLEKVALTCSPELFLLTVIAICFGTAFLTNLAGVSLSLGAFLAGLLVSESRFSEHALGETMPLQILFSATFFVSVGMLLDLRFFMHNWLPVITAIVIVLLIKVLTTGTSVALLSKSLPIALSSGLLLGQIGEFSFVLERAGREAGLSPAGMGIPGSQTFIATSVVLMILTPFLSLVGTKLSTSLVRKREARELVRAETEEIIPTHLPQLSDHVIVAGYGQAARRLVRVLDGSRIPFIITTLSPGGANEAESWGLYVLRGDSSKVHTLMLAGVERSKIMVIADDDPATAHRIAIIARTLNPTMRIVIRTRYISEIEPLNKSGADRVIAEELESIVQLFAEVLRDYRIPAEEIEAHEEAVRRGGYAALLGETKAEEPVVTCNPGEDCLETRTVTVRPGSQVSGKTIAEFDLEDNFAITIRSIRREGEVIDEPSPTTVLIAGDEIVLAGTASAFAQAAPLFRTIAATEKLKSLVTDFPSTDSGTLLVPDMESLVQLKVENLNPECSHLDQTQPVLPSARGCEDCLRIGERWVHLRICMTCGHVGCCDSSKNKHATKHSLQTTHPIIKSLQPGEDWAWCYVDKIML
jgi:monovalent cation:H+ antiporter-2, CPA2 family